jgi:uracil-DNA glycosylase family 4
VDSRELLQLADCGSCPLNGKSQPVFGHGPERADLVVVGEAPGRQEARTGKPFIGQSGMLLDATLEDVGLSRERTFVTNTVLCRPTDESGNDAPPPQKAIECCSKRLQREVTSRQPQVIVPVGATAASVFTGHSKISEVQGATFRWQNTWVIPTYHPAAVLHGGTGFYDPIWDTMRRIGMLVNGQLPYPPVNGVELNYEFYGHRGERIPLEYNGRTFWTWTGYWEATSDEVEGARKALLELLAKANRNTRKMELALDTESRSTSHFDPMLMVQIGNNKRQIALTWAVIAQVREELRAVLMHPNIIWDLWNTAHDRKVLRYWLRAELEDRDRDGMCYALGITEKMEQTSLKYQARQWLNADYYEQELEEWLPSREAPFDCIPPDVMAKYGCHDAYNTYELVAGGILPTLCDQEGTRPLVENLLLRANRTFAEWEYDGAYIDREYADGLEAEWVPIIEAAVAKVQDYAAAQGFPKDPKVTSAQTMGIPCPECCPTTLAYETDGGHGTGVWEPGPDRKLWRQERIDAGYADESCKRCMKRRFVLVPDNRINVRSSKQLQHLCFDMLRMKQGPDGRSCNEAFWETNKEHQLTKLVMEYRELDHLLRNYVRGIRDDIGPDGHVHPDFLLGGTVTGRLAIHNPPLQTLPKWGTNPKLAKMIRRMFAADTDEYLIVDVDYSNLELFVAWHYSGDEKLGEALTRPGPNGKPDYHRHAAAAMFNTPFEQVSGDMRFNSKFVTFGVAYGRQAYSLAQGELKALTGGDERVAQGYIDKFWTGFPKWKKFYDECQWKALHEQELTTTLGRKRRWRLVMPSLENHIKNQAVNFPLQSLASDICLSAGIRLTEALKERNWGRVLFTVHDSLVFLVRKRFIHQAVALIEKEMTATEFETCAQFKVEIEVGPNLGDVEEYDPNRNYE